MTSSVMRASAGAASATRAPSATQALIVCFMACLPPRFVALASARKQSASSIAPMTAGDCRGALGGRLAMAAGLSVLFADEGRLPLLHEGAAALDVVLAVEAACDQ